MDPKFRQYADLLEPNFQALMAMDPVSPEALPKEVPSSGIYLFSEGPTHLYVGRSNGIRGRIGRHSRKGATYRMAAFAFQLAREATGNTVATYTKTGSRQDLMNDAAFVEEF